MNKASTLLLVALLTLSFGAHAVHVTPPAAQAALERAQALDKEKKPAEALQAFIQAIETDPDFLEAHDRLQEFDADWSFAAYQDKNLKSQAEEVDKTVKAKYQEWAKRFPDSIGIQYGLAVQYYNAEDPKAKPYLLKVAARDPSIAKVYFMLAIDADRWGDSKGGLEYMHQASMLEPHNADYAFYYASSLMEIDPVKGEAASLEVAKRFPANDRGAQALYWLGAQAPNEAKRVAVWEQLRTQFPPEKFRWSAGAMSGLFEIYLRTDPARALKFAGDMQTTLSAGDGKDGVKDTKEWVDRVALAQTYTEVNKQIAAGKADEAMGLLDKLTVSRYSSNAAMISRLKAQVMAAAGKTKDAYNSMLQQQTKTPDDDTRAALRRYGTSLGKSAAQVDADLQAALDAGAKDAPRFELQMYASDDTVSLAKLKGKVVFITFWFPGCGPCRGEFPHFETVMRQFRNNKNVVYLGINGERDQDEYVVPFMASTKFSFTPLKGTEAVTGADGYNVRGYPSNFLIDRSGRIVYSNFRADDADSERSLQRMIESLL